MYCVSGAAKILTTSDPHSLRRKLISRSGFTDQSSVHAAERVLGATELAVELGQHFHNKSRIVRSGSMILFISAWFGCHYVLLY